MCRWNRVLPRAQQISDPRNSIAEFYQEFYAEAPFRIHVLIGQWIPGPFTEQRREKKALYSAFYITLHRQKESTMECLLWIEKYPAETCCQRIIRQLQKHLRWEETLLSAL